MSYQDMYMQTTPMLQFYNNYFFTYSTGTFLRKQNLCNDITHSTE